jgi:hypothetical protein
MSAYVPCGVFRRTDAERRDQELAWNRSDQEFFAAGACHILAWTFLETYPDAGFELVDLRKVSEKDGFHVVASNGRMAFDHAGWTPLDELVGLSVEEFTTAETAAFAERFRADIATVRSVIAILLSSRSITSDMIDNTNGLIAVRALLTDVFFIDQAVLPPR